MATSKVLLVLAVLGSTQVSEAILPGGDHSSCHQAMVRAPTPLLHLPFKLEFHKVPWFPRLHHFRHHILHHSALHEPYDHHSFPPHLHHNFAVVEENSPAGEGYNAAGHHDQGPQDDQDQDIGSQERYGDGAQTGYGDGSEERYGDGAQTGYGDGSEGRYGGGAQTGYGDGSEERYGRKPHPGYGGHHQHNNGPHQLVHNVLHNYYSPHAVSRAGTFNYPRSA